MAVDHWKVNVYCMLLFISCNMSKMCVLANAEQRSDSVQTDRSAEAVAADGSEQALSPVQQYMSYDDRPLPAIRRFSRTTCSVVLVHCQFYCHSRVA